MSLKEIEKLGIKYNVGVGKNDEKKIARERERLEKECFQFSLPIRCCWLFPKIRMPGMSCWDDAYGELID